jgi:hypothetical protein
VIYVYCRNVKTGAEVFCGSYTDWRAAIVKIKMLYGMDANMGSLGDYYYFAKEH